MNDPLLDAMRAALTALLPGGAFLRRDRGPGLYVTDTPRLDPDGPWRAAAEAAGFRVEAARGLASLFPGEVWMDHLAARFPSPPNALCASMARFQSLPVDEASLRLFARGLKALESGDGGDMYEKSLRQRAAVCLRSEGGGGLYACALILYLLKGER